jgi:hypothetical protein
MKKGLGNEIYSGAASFGKLRAVIGVVFGTVVGIALITGGIFAIIHKIKLDGKTTGISIDDKEDPIPVPNCSSTNDQNIIDYRCHFKLKYNVGSEKYSKVFYTSGSTNYSDQTDITVYYDTKDPNNSSLTKDDYHIMGYIMIAIGILLLFSSWISLWIVYNYKFAAAASGTAAAIHML